MILPYCRLLAFVMTELCIFDHCPRHQGRWPASPTDSHATCGQPQLYRYVIVLEKVLRKHRLILILCMDAMYYSEEREVLRKNSLHGNIAASVIFKLFFSGNERCHTPMTWIFSTFLSVSRAQDLKNKSQAVEPHQTQQTSFMMIDTVWSAQSGSVVLQVRKQSFTWLSLVQLSFKWGSSHSLAESRG